MTGGSVAAAFRGEWVPASAACTSPLKLVIGANVVTSVNGRQRAEYRQIEQFFTCRGHDVNHVTVLSTDAMGDSPFLIYLDASKKTPTQSRQDARGSLSLRHGGAEEVRVKRRHRWDERPLGSASLVVRWGRDGCGIMGDHRPSIPPAAHAPAATHGRRGGQPSVLRPERR
jgi:hypothetical protein